MGRQPLRTDIIRGNGSDQYGIDTVIERDGFDVISLTRRLRSDRILAIDHDREAAPLWGFAGAATARFDAAWRVRRARADPTPPRLQSFA